MYDEMCMLLTNINLLPYLVNRSYYSTTRRSGFPLLLPFWDPLLKNKISEEASKMALHFVPSKPMD